MPVAGKVTVKKTRTQIILSDGSGQSYTLPRSVGKPLLLDLDPRLDLTQPIYDQVRRIAATDSAMPAGTTKRKRHAHAA